MQRVLVTGTNNSLGQSVIANLARHDFSPVVVAGELSGQVVAVDAEHAIDRIAVDLSTFDSLREALGDVSTLIHTADFRPVKGAAILDAARTIASACADSGTHLIYVSRVGVEVSSIKHRKKLLTAEQVIKATPNLGFTIQRITHPHGSLEQMMQARWLSYPPTAPVQSVDERDVADRLVGLTQAGPSGLVQDFGGPELLRFSEAAFIYKQVRNTLPRKVPIPPIGIMKEAIDGAHVCPHGDRGHRTFRNWLEQN